MLWKNPSDLDGYYGNPSSSMPPRFPFWRRLLVRSQKRILAFGGTAVSPVGITAETPVPPEDALQLAKTNHHKDTKNKKTCWAWDSNSSTFVIFVSLWRGMQPITTKLYRTVTSYRF